MNCRNPNNSCSCFLSMSRTFFLYPTTNFSLSSFVPTREPLILPTLFKSSLIPLKSHLSCLSVLTFYVVFSIRSLQRRSSRLYNDILQSLLSFFTYLPLMFFFLIFFQMESICVHSSVRSDILKFYDSFLSLGFSFYGQ